MRPIGPPLFVMLCLAAGCGADSGSDARHVTFAVTRGPLATRVVARGSLAPNEQLSCIAKRSGYITSMAADGSRVEKGQIVVELDGGELEKETLDVNSALKVMEAELMSKLADLNNRKNQARAQVDEVERDLQLAQIEYKNLVGGAHIDPSTRIAAGEDAKVARVSAGARARELAVLQQLRRRGVVTEEEYEGLVGQVNVLNAGARQADAVLERVLEGPEPDAVVEARLAVQLKAYRLNVAQKWLEDLERQEQEIEQRHKAKIRRQQTRLGRLESDLEKTRISAPAAGVLLVKTLWGRKVGPGRRIWRGVPLCSVADISRMVVDIKVDGRTRALLAADQHAEVVVDAIFGRVFAARVEKVGNFGRDAFEHLDARTREIVGEARRRVFNVRVVLDPVDDVVLKPGLMAGVTILVDEAPEVLQVPREAIRNRQDERAVVRVVTRGGIESRPVEIGRDNGDMVEILSGVVEGESVVLGDG